MTSSRILLASLMSVLVAACATNHGPKFESARSQAESLAMLNRFQEAGRHMAAFAETLPAGSFYQMTALLDAADFYSAAESRGAAMTALNNCLGVKAEGNARSMQALCDMKRQQFMRGEFITPARVRANVAARARAEREVEEQLSRERVAAPAFAPPMPGPMAMPTPMPNPAAAAAPRVAAPAATRRELFDASSCLTLDRDASPHANPMGLRNRCNHTVHISFCTMGDAQNAYLCEGVPPGDIGGGMRSYGRGSMSIRAGGFAPIIPYGRSTGALWIGCASRDGGSVLPFLTGVRPPQGTCR